MRLENVVEIATASLRALCDSDPDKWTREYLADVVSAAETNTLLTWLIQADEDLRELAERLTTSTWLTQTKELALNLLVKRVDQALKNGNYQDSPPLKIQELGEDCIYFFSKNSPVICVDKRFVNRTDRDIVVVTVSLPEYRLVFKANYVNYTPENLYALRNAGACSVIVKKASVRPHSRMSVATPGQGVVQALDRAVQAGHLFVENYGDSLEELLPRHANH